MQLYRTFEKKNVIKGLGENATKKKRNKSELNILVYY